MSVHINSGRWRAPRERLEEAVRITLVAEGVEAGEVSLTLLKDEEIHELNRRYLGHDWVTDVLSFALHESGEPPLGDLYLGYERARQQAEERGLSLEEELVRLAVHGTLHLLGYDHPEGEDREECPLFLRQERLVRQVFGKGPADPPRGG